MRVDELLQRYIQAFDLNSADLVRIEHADAIIAVVYKVLTPHDKPLILKICSNEAAYHRELFFLKNFEGSIPVPKVYKEVAPTPDHPGALLLEYIEGTLVNESNISDDLAFDLGKNLALIHSKRAEHYDYLQPKRQKTTDPLEYFQVKFVEELAECRGHLSASELNAIQHYFESHKHELSSVDGPCYIHRDFRPGNLIVHSGKLASIIDWAGACFGFAEQDFCALPLSDALLTGYSSIRKLPSFEKTMPLLRLGKALGIIGFTFKQGTWKGRDQKLYEREKYVLEQILQNQPWQNFSL